MRAITAIIFLSLFLVALCIPVAQSPAPACADVGIITARASGEPPGEGIIGSLAAEIERASAQSVSRANVDYPALLVPYVQSSSAGTEALTQQLTDAVSACPQQKVVLLGYSQGAHIIGDVLAGGGGGGLGGKTPPIDGAISDKVVAVVQMGDPRSVAEESFNRGTSTNDGLFPREADQSLEGMAEKIAAFCDARDTFCDSGFSTAVHLGYTRKYNDQALQFVMKQIGG